MGRRFNVKHLFGQGRKTSRGTRPLVGRLASCGVLKLMGKVVKKPEKLLITPSVSSFDETAHHSAAGTMPAFTAGEMLDESIAAKIR